MPYSRKTLLARLVSRGIPISILLWRATDSRFYRVILPLFRGGAGGSPFIFSVLTLVPAFRVGKYGAAHRSVQGRRIGQASREKCPSSLYFRRAADSHFYRANIAFILEGVLPAAVYFAMRNMRGALTKEAFCGERPALQYSRRAADCYFYLAIPSSFPGSSSSLCQFFFEPRKNTRGARKKRGISILFDSLPVRR